MRGAFGGGRTLQPARTVRPPACSPTEGEATRGGAPYPRGRVSLFTEGPEVLEALIDRFDRAFQLLVLDDVPLDAATVLGSDVAGMPAGAEQDEGSKCGEAKLH